eukprot:scaffold68857_cov73-Cyclotella_meneghiniana.AAC.1
MERCWCAAGEGVTTINTLGAWSLERAVARGDVPVDVGSAFLFLGNARDGSAVVELRGPRLDDISIQTGRGIKTWRRCCDESNNSNNKCQACVMCHALVCRDIPPGYKIGTSSLVPGPFPGLVPGDVLAG